MERTYRWLGGIGYILTFVPYLGLVANILAAAAWIMMGGETRQTVFKVAGILMILSSVITIVFVFLFLPFTIFSIASADSPLTQADTPQTLGKLLEALGILATGLVVLITLGAAAFIAEIFAHFQAAKIFKVSWFRYAAWLRVAAAAVFLLSIPLVFITFLPLILGGASTPQEILMALVSFLWPLAAAVILGILAIIFSAIAFFTIPELPPPPPPT